MFLHRQSTRRGSRRYTYWVVTFSTANGRRRKTVGRTSELSRGEAWEKAKTLAPTPMEAGSLEELWSDYALSRSGEISGGTLALHRTTYEYVKKALGNTRPQAIVAKDLMKFREHLKDLRGATIALHCRNFRTMLNWAVKHGYLRVSPFSGSYEKPCVPSEWRYVSCQDVEALCQKAPTSWQILLRLCRYAALRRDEALHLRWTDLDWERSRINVVARADWAPKSGRSRVVPLNSVIAENLKPLQQNSGTIISGICVPNIVRDFRVLARRTGVAPYAKPLHTLRKSCISDWARSFGMPTVKSWAGHADIETTAKFYCAVSDEEFERAATTGGPNPDKKR